MHLNIGKSALMLPLKKYGDFNMKDYAITSEELSTLRGQLPHGANKRIAQKLDTTEAYVSNVLHGKKYNLNVLYEAIRLRDREIKRRLKIKSSL